MLCLVLSRLAGLRRLCLSMIWPFRIPSRTTIWPTWGSNSSIPSSNNKATLPNNNKVILLSNNKAILPSNNKAILPSSTTNRQ